MAKGQAFSAAKIADRQFKDLKQLEKLVIEAATQYEREGYAEDPDGLEITDTQYDEMLRVLRAHNPKSKVFNGTSPSKVKPTGATVVHNPPLTSIMKADGEEKKSIFEKWRQRCAEEMKVDPAELELALSTKHDGVCARFNYKFGKLVSAGLRPRDGINGTDITRHAKYLMGVPTELPLHVNLSLNAEIECHMADFEAVNAKRIEDGEEPYKNPRNYTAGCLGRDDPEENKDSRLQVAFHNIINHDEWALSYLNEAARCEWAHKTLGLKNYIKVLIKKGEAVWPAFTQFEESSKKSPYYVDGVVIKINDLEAQWEMGHHGDDPTKEPRGAIAWKFEEQVATATVKELIWEGSRTGRIVPTAVFEEAVNLADTAVSRATCNNYGWAMKAGIGPGTKVQVIKAGKIIPKVIGVVSGALNVIEFGHSVPKFDPIYGEAFPLTVVENEDSGSLDLVCDARNYPPRLFKAWLFYIQSIGGKGLGPSAMEKIMLGGRVKHLADLYNLSIEDLLKSGFTARQASLALATIHMVPPKNDDDTLIMDIIAAKGQKKKVAAWQFFAALGIHGAGRTAGKALFERFRDFNKIRSATVATLTTVAGIGESTAESIYAYFQEHVTEIDELMEHIELELPKSGSLTGKSFCLTGAFTLGKKHWEGLIQEAGGTIKSSVGKSTNYLIQEMGKTDGSPSSKEVDAAKHGTKVISVIELGELLK